MKRVIRRIRITRAWGFNPFYSPSLHFHEATRQDRRKPVVRSYWNGHPDNLVVETPEGRVLPYAPWMDKHFEIRLDPFMCDPDPEDLMGRA